MSHEYYELTTGVRNGVVRWCVLDYWNDRLVADCPTEAAALAALRLLMMP